MSRFLGTVVNKGLTDRIQEKRKCKRSSCRVYASNLRRINKEFSGKPFTINLSWLHADAKRILEKIKKLANVNQQRNFVSSALVGFDLLKDAENKEIFNQYLKKLNAKKAEMQRSGEMTSKQKAKYIDWKEILKLRRLLGREVNLARLYSRADVTRKDFLKIQRYLLLSLLTELPPTRNDYADVQIISEKDFNKLSKKNSDNFLVTARGGYKLYWRRYKTARTYGQILVFIPKHSKSLQRLLVKHIKYLRKHFPQNTALLLNQKFGKLSRNALTKYLQRMFKQYFKKSISTTMLRQIFLTSKYNKKELEEQQETSRLMGHSMKTQIADYIKKTD